LATRPSRAWRTRSGRPSATPDRLFRIGGEGVALLLPGLSAGEAVAVAERVRQAVSECPFRLPLRVSVGIASHPDDARDRRRLLELAEEALYSAKRAGKDQTHLATA
jgi:diguanylate cyclase (GGDEF)-like protein